MKLRRVIEQMEALLNAKHRKRRRQAEELKDLLKRLKKKERKLKREAKGTEEPEAAGVLRDKLKVVRAQRHKGVEALKALRKN